MSVSPYAAMTVEELNARAQRLRRILEDPSTSSTEAAMARQALAHTMAALQARLSSRKYRKEDSTDTRAG